MPTRNNDFDRLDPAEYPEPDDDAAGLIRCSACRTLIHEESERCPACGEYVVEGERQPRWIWLTLLVCLGMSIGWVIWG